ncbi:MAG: amidohydrolase [Candidatus Bipolaricaulia bacterium]
MLAIRGGTVLTPEERIANGVVLIDGSRIDAVGKDVTVPADADVIDADGKYVIPGLIEPHCHVSLFADGIDPRFYDGNEMTDPITPHMRALDAIHPEDLAFADMRAAGITTISISPGSGNVIGGQTAIVKTVGRSADDMLVRAPAAMKMALGENPKRVYGEQKKLPSTRMGNAAILREWLTKAKAYVEKRALHAQRVEAFERGDEEAAPDPFEVDVRLEVLGRVITRELQAHIHAHRADDIMTAIRIAEEFDLDYVLIHATEGYKIADLIASKGVPCIPGPILFSRMKLELRGLTPENAGILANAGVKVAIQTDEGSAVRYLTLNAAVCAREGMKVEDALRAITLTAAEILRIDDRVGSLEAGKDADVAILSAHPLDISNARVEHVLIGGKTVYQRDESKA